MSARGPLIAALLLLALAAGTTPAAAQRPAPDRAAPTAMSRAERLERVRHFESALAELRGVGLTGSDALHRARLRDTVRVFRATRDLARAGRRDSAEAALRALKRRLDPVRDTYLFGAVSDRLRRAAPHGGVLDDVWDFVKGPVKTVGTWLVWAAIVVLLIGAVAVLRELRRLTQGRSDGIGIALEDMAAPPADRPDRNRALGRDMAAAITAASGGGSQSAPEPELDLARGLDEGVVMNVRVSGDELAALEPYLQDSAMVSFGPFAFSPRQLASLFGAGLARRHTHELRGYASGEGTTARLAVELTVVGGDKRQWSVEHDGDGARSRAVVEAARRAVFEVSQRRMATNWESECAYREAREALSVEKPTGVTLTRARRKLERALAYDPANVLARFELANVLRRFGANADAVGQFDFFEKPMPGSALSVPPALRYAIRYGRAVALSKGSWRHNAEAVAELEALLADVKKDTELEDRMKTRLELLAMSGLATARVYALEQWRTRAAHDRLDKRRQEVFTDIVELCLRIADRANDADRSDWTTLMHARAVAENARGRAAYLLNNEQDTFGALDQALSLAPELGDAHLNMASALMQWKREGGDRRMRWHVERAHEISPSNLKSIYMYGVLERREGNTDEARKWFGQGAKRNDRWSLFALAELDWDAGDPATAVDLAARSFIRDRRPDWRAKVFVTWVSALPADQVPPAALALACDLAATLRKETGGRRKLSEPLQKAIERVEAMRTLAATGD